MAFSVGRVVGELVLTDNWTKTLTTAAQMTTTMTPKLGDLGKTATETAAALDKLEKEAKQYTDAMSSFGGGNIIGQANAAVKAVNDLGGATKLTATEQKTLNATLNEAISKYEALGQKAPADMQKLADATKQVNTNAKGSGVGGIFGSMFGQFTMAGLATKAISGVTTEVARMAETAGKMTAVQNSFEKLTTSIGQNSEKMRDSMHEGTRGLVTDFDLMTQANKAMLLGLPITADGMGDLAKTATVLGKAMGQDATKSLDDLITALGRSSPKILDNLGLTVDIAKANEIYAAKLHKTTEELTDQEKQMAFYNAAMLAGKRKVEAIGEQTQTLGEQISRVWTYIENKTVQTFKIVNEESGKMTSNLMNDLWEYAKTLDKVHRMRGYNDPVGDIFDANALMEIKRASEAQDKRNKEHTTTVVDLAAAYDTYAKSVGKTVAQLDENEKRKVRTDALLAGAAAGPHKYPAYVAPPEPPPPDYTKELAAATAAFAKLDEAKKKNIFSALEMNKADEDIIAKLGVSKSILGAAKTAHDQYKTALNQSADAAKALADAHKAITAAAIPLTEAQKQVALTNQANNASATDTAKVLGISAAAVQNYYDELKNGEEVSKAVAKSEEDISKAFKKNWTADEKARVEAAQKTADASGKALADQLKTANEYYDKNAMSHMNATEKAVYNINKERDAAVAALDKQGIIRGEMYDYALGQIDEFYQHELDLANETEGTLIERLDKRGIKTKEVMATMAGHAAVEYERMEKAGVYTAEQLHEAWLRMTNLTEDAMGNLAQKTIAALGSISQAFSQLASSIGGKMGGIFSSLASLTGNLAAAKEEAGKWAGADVGIASSFFDKNASSATKWAAGVQSATAIAGGAMDVWKKTTEAANSSQAAFAGAMSGASAGAAFGPWGAAIGAAAGALTGFIRGLTAGRRAIVDFADSMGGFRELQDQLVELGQVDYDRLWAKINNVDKGNAKEAAKVIAEVQEALANAPAALAEAAGYKTREELQKTADDAKRVYEYMAASGKYSAEVLEEAFKKMNEASGDESAKQAEKQKEQIDAITAKYKDQFDKLNSEYDNLYKSVAAEAEEAEMGVVEMKERERMKQIDAERDALQAKQDAEIKAQEEANAGILNSAQQTKLELNNIYGDPIRIPYYFDPLNAPQGVPTTPTPSPAILNSPMAGGGKPTVINMYQDGKKTATALLPHLADQYEVLIG